MCGCCRGCFGRLFLEGLMHLHHEGQLAFFGDLEQLGQAAAFTAWLAPFRKFECVVYAKPPFGGPKAVLAYLSRYTHRVAISNPRHVAGYALVMFAMWWVMMIAMMLPSAAPVLLLFAKINRKDKAAAAPLIPTWLFAMGYLVAGGPSASSQWRSSGSWKKHDCCLQCWKPPISGLAPESFWRLVFGNSRR